MTVKILPTEPQEQDTYIYLGDSGHGGVDIVARRGDIDQIILQIFPSGIVRMNHRYVGIKQDDNISRLVRIITPEE